MTDPTDPPAGEQRLSRNPVKDGKYAWRKGQSGNPSGRRYTRYDLPRAINAFMIGDAEAWKKTPKPVQMFIEMWYARVQMEEPGFLKEWVLRWQGAVPKTQPVELQRPVIVLQPVQGALEGAPAIEKKPELSPTNGTEGTTLPSAPPLESRTNGVHRHRPLVMPVLDTTGSVQTPIVFDLDAEDEEGEDDLEGEDEEGDGDTP